MVFFAKTAAYGLFSALLSALTVTGEPTSGVPSAQDLWLEPPTLKADARTSATGYYTLSWDAPDTPTGDSISAVTLFELQVRTDADVWRPQYTGPDRATTITGMPDGRYVYRVRVWRPPQPPARDPAAARHLARSSGREEDFRAGLASAWSIERTVDVRHYGLVRVVIILAVGACVFLATLVLVITGHRRLQT